MGMQGEESRGFLEGFVLSHKSRPSEAMREEGMGAQWVSRLRLWAGNLSPIWQAACLLGCW